MSEPEEREESPARIRPLGSMTRDERSQLLFFETCAVDRAGLVDTRRMNESDMRIAKRWNDEGFVKFGRIKFEWVSARGDHWCELSEDAWRLAHEERKERAVRMDKARVWEKTSE